MGHPLLAWAVHRLSAAGVPEPERDAVILLAAVLGRSRESLYRDRPVLTAAEEERFRSLVERRAQREPVAYLTGHREFYGLDLSVTPRVLIPRPESETLVEWVLTRVPAEPGRVVDVGTGSGAVALALAKAGPSVWAVEAVDLDLQALEVARENRRRLGLSVQMYPSDLLAQVKPGILAVVANLPYVALTDAVDPEVAYEPRHAVYAAEGGLALIDRLVDQASTKLRDGGTLALEVGAGQAERVLARLRRAGFEPAPPGIDLQGTARVVGGVWRRDGIP